MSMSVARASRTMVLKGLEFETLCAVSLESTHVE